MDGLARDDDYFIPEEELGSAGCSANAPVWDPIKVEMRRMIDRLLALEETRLMARLVEQAV